MQLNPEYKNLSAAQKRALLEQLLKEKIKRSKSKSQTSDLNGDNVASLNLEADAILDPTIVPENSPDVRAKEPEAILLTGATGFLGAFLLDELLQQTSAKIYCLVRAANPESGKERIKRNLENYLLWKEEVSDRLVAVHGDLSRPHLGLSSEQFASFARELVYLNRQKQGIIA